MFLQLLLLSTVASLKVQLRPVRPQLKEVGISSLLKITAKNVNNETRDDLLAIVDEAERKNEEVVVENGRAQEGIKLAGEAIVEAIAANAAEKESLNEALAKNGVAQAANVKEMTGLEASKTAIASSRTFVEATPAVDPTGEILKIIAGNEKANAASISDNTAEAKALKEAREAIEGSVATNGKELENLLADQAANRDALAANAAERAKLEATAASIAKIQEVITDNSEKLVKKLRRNSGRCKSAASTIKTLRDCENAAAYLKLEVSGPTVAVSTWPKQCGCSYQAISKQLQFNAFNHPCYCWDKGCVTPNSVTQHMGAQDRDGATRNPICFEGDESDDGSDDADDDKPEEAVFEKLDVGVGRCTTIKSNIRSLANCQNAAVMLGLKVEGAVSEVSAWGKQCGCSYNPTSKQLQFNAFNHPCYCWDQGCQTPGSVVVHMGAQDRDGATRNPICFKKENRS